MRMQVPHVLMVWIPLFIEFLRVCFPIHILGVTTLRIQMYNVIQLRITLLKCGVMAFLPFCGIIMML